MGMGDQSLAGYLPAWHIMCLHDLPDIFILALTWAWVYISGKLLGYMIQL